MIRYVAPVLSLSLLAACGGKPAVKPPAAPSDPCAAGLHASGVTARAATWDAVLAFVDASAADVCAHSPCGPGEPLSLAGARGLAVKVSGGYTVVGEVWTGADHAPTATVTHLGDLLRVALDEELLGREPVTLDDGTDTTATVVAGRIYTDYVIDPGSGKVLFLARCAVDGDHDSQTPKLDRAGASFSYSGCRPKAASVIFTADQAAACPTEGVQ